jgi:hypothetical protein
VLNANADEDGVVGDDAAGCFQCLVAAKSRVGASWPLDSATPSGTMKNAPIAGQYHEK